MNTALSLYEDQERAYPPHILLGVMSNQADESKKTNRGIVETLKRLVKLVYNAQSADGVPEKLNA